MAVQQYYEKEAGTTWPKKTKVALDVPQKAVEGTFDGAYYMLVQATQGKEVADEKRQKNKELKIARARYQASKSRFGHPPSEKNKPAAIHV